MTRQEHLEWCKERAIEELEAGGVTAAYASLLSDMRKHEETANHSVLGLMTSMFFGGFLDTPPKMRKFIEGFN